MTLGGEEEEEKGDEERVRGMEKGKINSKESETSREVERKSWGGRQEIRRKHGWKKQRRKGEQRN